MSRLPCLASCVLAVILLSPLAAKPGTSKGTCDNQGLTTAKEEFLRQRDLHRENPSPETDQALRAASIEYVKLAEECYQAISGNVAPSSQIIDEGGVWFNSLNGGVHAAVNSTDSPYQKHNLTGTKWGTGTSFLTCCENLNAQGPRLPGGTVTYSLMANGVDLSQDCGMGCTNTAITSLPTFENCFLEELSNAFGAWSAVADIDFLPVTDGGLAFNVGAIGDIRIGAHTFDGASNVLAHGFFPPPNGTTAAGDLHLDTAEDWHCDPNLGGIDIGIVFLHEIGHTLGLNHEPTDTAVMEAFYNPALTFGPLADDIIGIGEIYGGSPVGKSFFYGDVGIGTDTPSASLHVRRNNGTARVRVQEASTTNASRTLFELVNNGGTFFTVRNTNAGSTWSFSVSSSGNFQVDNPTIGAGAEMVFFNSGSVRMGPGGTQRFLLDAAGNLAITGNLTANGMLYPSDRNLKENIAPVDGVETLGLLSKLPIASWNYKDDSSGTRHLGPMAQDFLAAFELGSDGTRINAMDATGVSLSALQGVYLLLQKQQEQIQSQQREIEALRARLQRLEQR